MKALRRNPARILAVTLVSIGAVGWGLLGPAGFDLVQDLFGSLLVISRALSSIAVMGILYRLTTRTSPKPVLVPVRV